MACCQKETYDDSCIFCRIVRGLEPDTHIIYQDEEVVCFNDINPAAPHHYLVVPRSHIRDYSRLGKKDAPLVAHMAHMGLKALKINNFHDLKDVSLGFHIPPRISVPHLHLHVLAPHSRLFPAAGYRCLGGSSCYLPVERLLGTLSPGVALFSPTLANDLPLDSDTPKVMHNQAS